MNFYTYIGLGPNKVYVRDMKNGIEYSGYEDFSPTLFLPSPQNKSNYKSLDSKPLASHTFGDIKDCKGFLAEYANVSNYSIYGNKMLCEFLAYLKFSPRWLKKTTRDAMRTFDTDLESSDFIFSLQEALTVYF